MPTYNVAAKDFSEFFRRNEKERLARAKAATVDAAKAGAEYLAKVAPKDTGNMAGGITSEATPTGARIDLPPFSAIVDQGSRPHMPPVEPIIEWVTRHAAQLGVSTDAEIESMAWAIAKTIERDGTRPTFFIRDAIEGPLHEDWVRRVLAALDER